MEEDAENPMNWPSLHRWLLTLLVSIATLSVGFCSTAYAGSAGYIMKDFGVSSESVTLGISLFVLGFALGPLIWAPLSEVLGRRPLLIWTFAAMTAFNAAGAVAPSMTALAVLRFFAGAIGSSPLTNAGGIIADMFQAEQRGLAMSLFAAAPFMGPVIGPIVGGFAGEALGWRWVFWLMTLFTGVITVAAATLLPETYAPVLLRRRAAAVATAAAAPAAAPPAAPTTPSTPSPSPPPPPPPAAVYRSKFDAKGVQPLPVLLATSLTRPWALLFREPIVLLLSLYTAIVYGVLYLLFAAFPIVYQRGYGWSPGVGGLSFVGVAVGMMCAIVYTIFDNRRYVRISREHHGMAPPESRLPPSIIGSLAIPAGLFMFAFTNDPSIPWIVSEIATVPFGFGMVLVFLSISNYLVDSYLIYAASVLAASAVLRSLFGAAFPLFAGQMYADLGIHWASAIPAFLALACVPFPILFYKYGARIRQRCKYSAEAIAFLEQRMQAAAAAAAAKAKAAEAGGAGVGAGGAGSGAVSGSSSSGLGSGLGAGPQGGRPQGEAGALPAAPGQTA
ncbi:hypothetical protein HXX76_012315 [Chlamydomonas incerta]|uniref:Major facilitator superfamily (MFS) profile domain-containing protein n=1 Tax=Chlamydomonas incerta TaxID=51695 RepID=A0A835SLB7_CHLIN|nr:hypothetical protein HXX76_012315 [Chlamydomonas incerta]|eukprot:KAG2427666.1 hypothetical protein HXX76_012315 [Chlamydomonas incerta]